jgi:hypothetical protein
MTSILANNESFQMVGARGILERTGGAIQIRQQVEAIEEAVNDRPAMVFDLAKALVETICKTILDELGVGFDNKFDAPKLLRETLIRLQLFPSGHESPSDVTESIKKTVNGLMTTVHGLCDLRTREGMASHGREAFSANLEPVQALLAASAADTVAVFLWNVHKSYSPAGRPERISYEDNSEFNDWMDQMHEPPVLIFELPYKHSEILFNLDRQAYCDALQEHLAEPDEDLEELSEAEEATERTEDREEQS